jgi:hypothetical protein
MEISITLLECCVCHIQFAISEEYKTSLKRSHNIFYCPKGHSQFYVVKSDIEQIREERDRAEHLHTLALKELEALKKKCKKTKKR